MQQRQSSNSLRVSKSNREIRLVGNEAVKHS